MFISFFTMYLTDGQFEAILSASADGKINLWTCLSLRGVSWWGSIQNQYSILQKLKIIVLFTIVS